MVQLYLQVNNYLKKKIFETGKWCYKNLFECLNVNALLIRRIK